MPLSIALSYDGGTTWPYVRDLEYENHYPEQVRLPRGSSPPGTLGQVSSQSHEAAGLPAQPGDPDPDRTEYSYPRLRMGCGWAAAREPLVQSRHNQVSLASARGVPA